MSADQFPVCAWAPVTHWEPAVAQLVLTRPCGHGGGCVPSCQQHLDEHPVGQAALRASLCTLCGAVNHLTVMTHYARRPATHLDEEPQP